MLSIWFGLLKKINKKIYYGIVVEVSGESNRNVYVDVPPFNNRNLDHIDNIGKDGINLQNYEDMIFFPSRTLIFTTPVIGGLARVLLPDNYPNHIESNAHDAVYLDMYSEQKLLESNRRAPASKLTQIKVNIIAGSYSGGNGLSGGSTGEPSSDAESTINGDGTTNNWSGAESDPIPKENINFLLLGDSHSGGLYGRGVHDGLLGKGHKVTRISFPGKTAAFYNGIITGKDISTGVSGWKITEKGVTNYAKSNSEPRHNFSPGLAHDFFKTNKFDVCVISLGTNDGMNLSAYRKNGTQNQVTDLQSSWMKSFLNSIKSAKVAKRYILVGPPKLSVGYAGYNPACEKVIGRYYKSIPDQLRDLSDTSKKKGGPEVDSRTIMDEYVRKVEIIAKTLGVSFINSYAFTGQSDKKVLCDVHYDGTLDVQKYLNATPWFTGVVNSILSLVK